MMRWWGWLKREVGGIGKGERERRGGGRTANHSVGFVDAYG